MDPPIWIYLYKDIYIIHIENYLSISQYNYICSSAPHCMSISLSWYVKNEAWLSLSLGVYTGKHAHAQTSSAHSVASVFWLRDAPKITHAHAQTTCNCRSLPQRTHLCVRVCVCVCVVEGCPQNHENAQGTMFTVAASTFVSQLSSKCWPGPGGWWLLSWPPLGCCGFVTFPFLSLGDCIDDDFQCLSRHFVRCARCICVVDVWIDMELKHCAQTHDSPFFCRVLLDMVSQCSPLLLDLVSGVPLDWMWVTSYVSWPAAQAACSLSHHMPSHATKNVLWNRYCDEHRALPILWWPTRTPHSH